MNAILRGALGSLALGAFLTTAALAQQLPPGVQKVATAKGDVWADSNGMSLYTYDRDVDANKSVYAGNNWPALMATASDKPIGDWTIADRPDGSKMWALKGKPVYLYVNDKAKGDVAGDGVGGIWHLAKP